MKLDKTKLGTATKLTDSGTVIMYGDNSCYYQKVNDLSRKYFEKVWN
jgi:hypothetical protein